MRHDSGRVFERLRNPRSQLRTHQRAGVLRRWRSTHFFSVCRRYFRPPALAYLDLRAFVRSWLIEQYTSKTKNPMVLGFEAGGALISALSPTSSVERQSNFLGL